MNKVSRLSELEISQPSATVTQYCKYFKPVFSGTLSRTWKTNDFQLCPPKTEKQLFTHRRQVKTEGFYLPL